MIKATRSRQGQRGNVMVLVALITPVLVGLVGLAVDGTMCYIVQTELSAAVDGAALGTGRLLSTNANPTNIAGEFLDANFRVGGAGFWGSYSLIPTVNFTNGITKTVTITAQVNVPLLFMRIFGQNSATVAATGTATRRDARVEFIIDRSWSMTNVDSTSPTHEEVINELITSAQGFVQGFTPGYDEMGLIVFDGSAVVGYPTTPWPAPQTYNGGGGPDINFCGSSAPYVCGSSTTDMYSQIGKIQANGGTAMGDALALAYIELQKAHMRDMAANGADTRMNVVVLFTDGVPSSAAIYPNINGTNNVISSSSGCTYKTDTASPSHPMYGAIEEPGSPPYSGSPQSGLYDLASLDGTQTSSYYMSHASAETSQTGGNEAGCSSFPGSALKAIPSVDRFNYNLSPNMSTGSAGYLYSLTTDGTKIYSGTAWSTSSPSSNYQWGLAAWDEVDNVAEKIRQDANYASRAGDTSPMSIEIMTIGYSGNSGGTDAGLLQKIANVSGCTSNGLNCYINTEPSGLYVQAANGTQLSNAMSTVLSAILRLSH
ncbi:MAG: pilus assembly protein [Bryobacteraceae bacterium]